MKSLIVTLLVGVLIGTASPSVYAQPPEAGAIETGASGEATQSLRFSFSKAPWQTVIEWFAAQSGYALEPIANYPDGTFTLDDPSAYSPMDALDELNHVLRLRSPPMTLIRNRNKLYLVEADQPLPAELVETIPATELLDRGKYETLQSIFDVGDLNIEDLMAQVGQNVSSVNSDFLRAYPSVGQIFVRETGENLRRINAIIENAKSRSDQQAVAWSSYTLKYLDAELFMESARLLLSLDNDTNQRDDGSLTIVISPSGNRLIVRGDAAAIKEFDMAASVIDIPEDDSVAMEIERPYYKSYPVLVDAKTAFAVIDRFLVGREGVRIQQAEETGAISVYGRREDHAIVAEVLEKQGATAGSGVEIVHLENARPTDILYEVQNLWGQNRETGKINGPVLIANEVHGYIAMAGTPQDVIQTRQMINDLDANARPTLTGPRTTTRVVPMTPRQRDQSIDSLMDYWPTTGRENRINIRMPGGTSPGEDYRDHPRVRSTREQDIPGMPPIQNAPRREVPDADQSQSPLPQQRPNDLSRTNGPNPQTAPSHSRDIANQRTFSWLTMLPSTQLMLLQTPGFDTGNDLLSSGAPGAGRFRDDYTPPQPATSVPGSEIEVRATEYGIVIKSEDLDALDDLETLLLDQSDAESADELPTFYFLKYRKVASMKPILEEFFGIAASSGGGAEGGGLLDGMMGNMLGDTAGDAASSLLGLGGGLGSSASASQLEGDVRLGMDVTLNLFYVVGATENDLQNFDMVVDMFDRPSAPQNPELVGQLRTVPVLYRDPVEMHEVIAEQLSYYFDSSSGGEGGGDQKNEAADMIKAVRQMTGGKGQGGGGADPESEKPVAKLGVDARTRQILVTGPEFIYLEVYQMVLQLDKPELVQPQSVRRIRNPGGDARMKARLLLSIFGDEKITIGDMSSESTGESMSDDAKKADANGAKPDEKQQQQNAEARREIFRALQQQGGGRGNAGGGNARGGGGGQRGGGGGGQRGGGGGGGGQRGGGGGGGQRGGGGNR